MKRVIYNLLIWIEIQTSKAINYLPFKFWRVKYGKFPEIRGKCYIRNYGAISFGTEVQINSNLESSQLGYYPRTILHTSQTGSIIIGDRCGLSNVCLNARQMIILKQGVRLGAGVKIYDNDFHDLYGNGRNVQDEKIPCSPVILEEGSFVGAGCIILKGVHIGANTIIGAGSVVTKSIPDNQVWAGNPARFIKER